MSVNTLGASYADGKSRGGAWLLPLVPIAISIFAISALVSYHLRASSITPNTIPQSVVIGVYEFLGWVPACMFFGLVFAWSSIWFVSGSIDRPGKKLLRVLGLTVALAVFGNLDAAAPHTGALGAWIGGGMASLLGSFLSHLLMAPITFLALLFATDSFWMSYFERRVLERTRAELQAAAVGAASDAGVEPAVPEEFKQLARTSPPEAAEAAADVDGDTDIDAYFERLDRGTAAPVAAEAISPEAPEPADVGSASDSPAPTRLSYFERRRLREEEEDARRAAATMAQQEEPTPSSTVPDAAMYEGLGEELAAPGAADLDLADAVQEEPVAAQEQVADDGRSQAEGASATAATPEHGTFEIRREPLFASPSVHDLDEEGDDEDAEEVAEVSECAKFRQDVEQADSSEVDATGATVVDMPAVTDASEDPAAASFATDGSADWTGDASFGVASVEVADQQSIAADDLGIGMPAAPTGREGLGSLPPEPEAEACAVSDGADLEVACSEASVVDEHAAEAIYELPVANQLPAVEREAEEVTGVESVEIVETADLSWQRPRGFLAPVVEEPAGVIDGVPEVVAESLPSAASIESIAEPEPDDDTDGIRRANAPAVMGTKEEEVVSIPRPADARRQMSLFGGAVDEDLLRDAKEICQSARRASVVLLQRKLRIDYEQARVVLAQLAERGVLELQEDGTQGRMLT